MAEANARQIGGTHYAAPYQHWDWTIKLGLGYLEGQATRYICRWRKKDGLQDLQKALHYVDKMIEAYPLARACDVDRLIRETKLFADANHLTAAERSICLDIASWQTIEDLHSAKQSILSLIETAEAKPVSLTDSNKHAERS